MRERAKVISWNSKGRYGFLESLDPAIPDLFVHRSGLVGRERLLPNEIVEYDVSSNAKGKMAANVVVVVAVTPDAQSALVNLDSKGVSHEQSSNE